MAEVGQDKRPVLTQAQVTEVATNIPKAQEALAKAERYALVGEHISKAAENLERAYAPSRTVSGNGTALMDEAARHIEKVKEITTALYGDNNPHMMKFFDEAGRVIQEVKSTGSITKEFDSMIIRLKDAEPQFIAASAWESMKVAPLISSTAETLGYELPPARRTLNPLHSAPSGSIDDLKAAVEVLNNERARLSQEMLGELAQEGTKNPATAERWARASGVTTEEATRLSGKLAQKQAGSVHNKRTGQILGGATAVGVVVNEVYQFSHAAQTKEAHEQRIRELQAERAAEPEKSGDK